MKRWISKALVFLLLLSVLLPYFPVSVKAANTVKYAVALYGIEQAKEQGGKKVGLIFGPALGEDFTHTYVEHNPTGTTASGNPHRCIHEDSWETIIYWNFVDPYVYEQCIGTSNWNSYTTGCTHDLSLNLSDFLANSSFVSSSDGDGPSVLYYEIKDQYRRWNTSKTVSGGWGSSQIRKVLNGGGSISEADAIISAMPAELQAVLAPQEIKYDTSYDSSRLVYSGTQTVYDKLWLPGSMDYQNFTSSVSHGYHPNEKGPSGTYTKFSKNNSNSYVSSNNARRGYFVNSSTGNGPASNAVNIWTRSIGGSAGAWGTESNVVLCITYNLSYRGQVEKLGKIDDRSWNDAGQGHYDAHTAELSDKHGIAFGFSLTRQDPQEVVVNLDANGGYVTPTVLKQPHMAESPFTLPTPRERAHYTFIGWNTEKDGTGDMYQTEYPMQEPGTKVTLYAQWERDSIRNYRVEHYQETLSLGNYTRSSTQLLTGNVNTEVSPAVKTEYADLGFVLPEVQTVTILDDDSLVVKYYYDRVKYDIVFNGNGSTSGQMKNQKMVVGVGSVLRPNTFSKRGAIFSGWNTEPDGSGTSYTNNANVIDLTKENGSTVTLYAQWLDNKDHAIEPTDGAVRVTLKAGQTVVIPDLPAGTSYTIREVDNPQGWTFDHTDGETGTILANQTNSATVYNVYHAVGSIPLQINKELVDGLTGESKPIEAGKFTFALIKSDGSQIQLASNEATDNEKVIYDDEGNEVNNPNYGKAIVTFDPIAYDESDIGKTYTYRIGEVNTPEGYTASDPINVTVSIADAGQGQLDITAQYDNNQTITNTDNSGGKLEIKKLVSGSAPEGAEFTFKVDLTDETGKTYTDTVNGKKSDESNVSITSGETVSLHADESVVFNLPAGIGYTVSEQTQDGWTLVQSSGETGTIVSGETRTATFTNAYNVEGTVTLEANKVLTGKDLTANEFTFEVLDAEGNVVATGTNDAEGKVSLVIPYTAEDVGNTYEYTVHEVKPEGDTFGVTYDKTIYGVSVAVSADNGKIIGNVSITDADKMTFTNTYDAKTDITVSGKKVLEGREFRDSDKWTFNLSSEDGPLPEETSVEITPINGDTFSFTIPFSVADMDGAQTKEFTYKVTESGSVLFVANDKSEKTFKVRVTDTKDGILKAELVDADNLDLTFTNKATVTLPATGSTTAIVLTIVGVVVIAGGLFFLLRKRKDDDEDE